jgi:hypothetical protein
MKALRIEDTQVEEQAGEAPAKYQKSFLKEAKYTVWLCLKKTQQYQEVEIKEKLGSDYTHCFSKYLF